MSYWLFLIVAICCDNSIQPLSEQEKIEALLVNRWSVRHLVYYRDSDTLKFTFLKDGKRKEFVRVQRNQVLLGDWSVIPSRIGYELELTYSQSVNPTKRPNRLFIASYSNTAVSLVFPKPKPYAAPVQSYELKAVR